MTIQKSSRRRSQIFDSDKNFYVTSTSTPGTEAFYSEMGFCLLWFDGGRELNSLIRIANKPGNDLSIIADRLENDNYMVIEDSNMFDNCGAVWNVKEQRFVKIDRTYEQELKDVEKDPWEIQTVMKQTTELQMIVALSYPGALFYVKDIHSSVRIPALKTDWSSCGAFEEELSSEEELVYEEGRMKHITKGNKSKTVKEMNDIFSMFTKEVTNIIGEKIRKSKIILALILSRRLKNKKK